MDGHSVERVIGASAPILQQVPDFTKHSVDNNTGMHLEKQMTHFSDKLESTDSLYCKSGQH
jgi:hypothetical protein